MKNICIKIKGIIVGLLFINLCFASTLSLSNREMATKLEIETNLEEKVVNVISKIYDTNKFAVTTNVLLVSPTNSTINSNTSQSFGALQLEGILPALETAHAIAGARHWASTNQGARILIGLSGRGDKDMPILSQYPIKTNDTEGAENAAA